VLVVPTNDLEKLVDANSKEYNYKNPTFKYQQNAPKTNNQTFKVN
jgi:hypothetical protein